jgi:hypothetical protein
LILSFKTAIFIFVGGKSFFTFSATSSTTKKTRQEQRQGQVDVFSHFFRPKVADWLCPAAKKAAVASQFGLYSVRNLIGLEIMRVDGKNQKQQF